MDKVFELDQSGTVIQLSKGATIPSHFSDLFLMCLEGNKRIGNMDKFNEIVQTYTPLICLIEDKSEEEIHAVIDAIIKEE